MPKHIIRTNNAEYRFSADRAAQTRGKQEGTRRQPSKPPSTRAELAAWLDRIVYEEGNGSGDPLGELVKAMEKEKP